MTNHSASRKRTVLITGTTSGIGQALSEVFAAEGFDKDGLSQLVHMSTKPLPFYTAPQSRLPF